VIDESVDHGANLKLKAVSSVLYSKATQHARIPPGLFCRGSIVTQVDRLKVDGAASTSLIESLSIPFHRGPVRCACGSYCTLDWLIDLMPLSARRQLLLTGQRSALALASATVL